MFRLSQFMHEIANPQPLGPARQSGKQIQPPRIGARQSQARGRFRGDGYMLLLTVPTSWLYVASPVARVFALLGARAIWQRLLYVQPQRHLCYHAYSHSCAQALNTSNTNPCPP